jgi:hypothetical protein
VVFVMCLCLAAGFVRGAQEKIPQPPADTTQIYVSSASGEPAVLPVESGSSSLKVGEVAGRDRKGFIELDGGSSGYLVDRSNPRIYLFVPRGPNVHPAFLVRLEVKGGKRRLPIQMQKGLAGFAVPTEQIVIPHYRVLSAVGELNFMEVTPRFPLVPGEYAVVGEDLKRIATFRVVAPSTN